VEEKPKPKAKGRMTGWRNQKRQLYGGMAVVDTWVQARHSKELRTIFARLAEPGWWGDAHRQAVAHWIHRRRAAPRRFEGLHSAIEIDRPSIGINGAVVPIGGRIIRPDGTFVELEPHEAAELQEQVHAALEGAVMGFLRRHKLESTVRDSTGVVTDRAGMNLPVASMTDKEFKANEERTIRRIAVQTKTEGYTELTDDAFICHYEGVLGVPSLCLVVRHAAGDRKLVALVEIKNGGTPPTIMFDTLASRIEKKLYPWAEPSTVEWLDVWLDPFSVPDKIGLARVRWPDPNGPPRDPEWVEAPSGPEMIPMMQKIAATRKIFAEIYHLDEDDRALSKLVT
jgi:hypothetical protein